MTIWAVSPLISVQVASMPGTERSIFDSRRASHTEACRPNSRWKRSTYSTQTITRITLRAAGMPRANRFRDLASLLQHTVRAVFSLECACLSEKLRPDRVERPLGNAHCLRKGSSLARETDCRTKFHSCAGGRSEKNRVRTAFSVREARNRAPPPAIVAVCFHRGIPPLQVRSRQRESRPLSATSALRKFVP